MRNKPLLCSLLLFLSFTGWAQPGEKGTRQLESGLHYHFLARHWWKAKPKMGDYGLVHITLLTDQEEEIFSTYDFGTDPEEYQIHVPEFNGDISEGLAMMRAGDSAHFWVPVDSLYRDFVPEFARGANYMLYHIRMDEILAPAALAKRKQVERAVTLRSDLDAIQRRLQQDPTAGEYYVRDSVVIIPHVQGEGPVVQKGRLVGVHYSGSLFSGDEFENSWDRGEPYYFFPDSNMVIEGWERAIAGAREGDSLTVCIPSPLAYGKRGAGGVIPPYAVLVFTLKIEKVYDPVAQWASDWATVAERLQADSLVYRTVIDSPYFAIAYMKDRNRGEAEPGDTVSFHYTFKTLDGHVIETSRTAEAKPMTLVLDDRAPLLGLKKALLRIPVGTTADVWLPSPMAYGQAGADQIDPFTNVRVTVEVLRVK